ncbi:MAG: DUF1801 domain-containing protein [Candidatus Bipolaricaulota bacterium]|nr:DUF1801 domain-containing protein [Candidatus Bipolaricaulota bacterium]
MANLSGGLEADEVGRFLDSVPSELGAVVEALRHVVRRTVPDAEETVLWDGLSYHTPWMGGRVKGSICQIVVRRGVVRLDFIHGIRLVDPDGLLEGDRLSKRYVPIRSVADARRLAIARLIHEASTIELMP